MDPTQFIDRNVKCIGVLPDGYQYRLVNALGDYRVIGLHPDKEPIGFYIEQDKLVPMDIVIK